MKYFKLVSLNENYFTNVIMEWDVSKYKNEKELRQNVYIKIDLLLACFKKQTLLSVLNEMQCEVFWSNNRKDCGCFESRFSIPLYFVNLILKQYNLKLIYGD